MAMRLSGLMSGMDTESVIEQLVMARRTKVDTAKKAQTKLQWTSDAWKTLNTKIKKFYDGALSNLRFESSYMKKTTKISNSNVVSVITGENAMNSVQSLEVDRLAKPGYLTGAQVGIGDQKGKMNLDSDSRLSKMGWDFSDTGKINVTVGGKQTEINLTGAATIGELVQAFRDAGLNASFDANNQRFYISSKDSGTDNDFTITAGNVNGLGMLQSLGLYYVDADTKDKIESIAKMTEEDVDKAIAGRLQESLDKVRNELINKRTGLESQRDELSERVNAKKDDYLDRLGLDSSATREQIQSRITELQAEGSLSSEEEEELLSWGKDLTSLENVQKELDEISASLTEEGELTPEKAESIEKSLRDEVNREIASAKIQLQVIADGAHKQDAEDAVIRLNGVEYTGSKNTFEINGLTLTVNSTTENSGPVTLTTEDDTDGIYDMIKNFIKEYNELINEMDKLYNADSSKGYEPLTDEEKEAMSEREIEEWEAKIKDSLLRRDDTLGMVSMAIKQMMISSVTVNGKQMSLSNFGIETLSYFSAPENEKNAFHIDGDPDDSNTSGNADKLKSMIASDPQAVVDFFVGLSRNLYSELTSRMAKTEYSSSYTIYEDVRMKQEYDGYTSKIKDLEKKLADYEDKWYQKFAQMETAMAKMQSSVSAVTALLGG